VSHAWPQPHAAFAVARQAWDGRVWRTTSFAPHGTREAARLRGTVAQHTGTQTNPPASTGLVQPALAVGPVCRPSSLPPFLTFAVTSAAAGSSLCGELPRQRAGNLGQARLF
jgi:hypothetical protein